MKTDASVGPDPRKAGTGRSDAGPAAATRGIGGRIGLGVVGLFVLLLGLVLIGAGYEEGPKKVADGTPGTITIERCAKDASRQDVECSGIFRSDEGGIRYDVEDFEPGADLDKGEKVHAMAFGPGWFDRGTSASFYVEGVRYWCVATAMFGVALFALSSTFRSGRRPMRYGTLITSASLLFGGLLGCGLSVFVNSVLM